MVAKSLDNYVNVRTHPIDLCQTRPGRTQAQTRETPTLTLTLALPPSTFTFVFTLNVVLTGASPFNVFAD